MSRWLTRSPLSARHRRSSLSERGDTDTDNSLSERTLTIIRTCAEALRLASGVVPGCGAQIQALLDIGLVLLDQIEKIRAWKGVKDELRRKVAYLLDMTGTVLQKPCIKHASGMETDLLGIEKILKEIRRFVNQRADSKGRKALRIITCKSDYIKVSAFGAQIDEALRKLSIKSLIQVRLDTGCLKKLQEEFRSPTKSFTEILGVLSDISARLSRLEAAINRTASADDPEMPRTNPNTCSIRKRVTRKRRRRAVRRRRVAAKVGISQHWEDAQPQMKNLEEYPVQLLIGLSRVWIEISGVLPCRAQQSICVIDCPTARLFAYGTPTLSTWIRAMEPGELQAW